jgi:hypothetical protein
LPNIRNADLDSLPSEQRESFVQLLGFYQFLQTNFTGYCLVRLRLADNTAREVFIPESAYKAFFAEELTAAQLLERQQSHLVSLKGEQRVEGSHKAIKGYDLTFRLVERPPEIVR